MKKLTSKKEMSKKVEHDSKKVKAKTTRTLNKNKPKVSKSGY